MSLNDTESTHARVKDIEAIVSYKSREMGVCHEETPTRSDHNKTD